ncbi:ABC transporter substrate-binding protein [Pontiella agarivorans]|uniref:ABC transporter substrate-binding protein n=1 Tax=Pontiella agarivorans TaxID=3038953 RepID=A0ABU5MXP9_9BACT|nr:ABC transporter substrate-binding protein [Pontiella agarivorans]MDZ8118949.1 ABC transporter substrate-binding protein [Pontiella agarivorans]
MKRTTLIKPVAAIMALMAVTTMAEPLKIAYSDWPGWVAWDIAKEKGFFEKHDVEVELLWFEYVASMDAFAAGKADAVCVANGDSVVLNATGARNVMILVNDYSNGNDKIVARSGITDVKALKGKKIGVEIGFLSHALLIKALEDNGMTEKDVELINMPTHQAAQVLASGDVDAIVAWQPHSGMALKASEGSSAVYTTADAPGIIYDTLAVAPGSILKRKADWQKVVAAWYDVIDYMADPANEEEMLKILSARVGLSPAEYKPFLSGTYMMSKDEVLKALKPVSGFESLYGSCDVVNNFFVANKVYEEPVAVKRTIDPSFTKSVK